MGAHRARPEPARRPVRRRRRGAGGRHGDGAGGAPGPDPHALRRGRGGSLMDRDVQRRGPLVVIGDTLLDVDVEGAAGRLCPDAPVPVVDVAAERARPGGAGLAALRAARDGAGVVLISAIGDDPAGRRLCGLLSAELELVRLPLRGETVRKTRVRAGGQTLLRLDTGDGVAPAPPTDGNAYAEGGTGNVRMWPAEGRADGAAGWGGGGGRCGAGMTGGGGRGGRGSWGGGARRRWCGIRIRGAGSRPRGVRWSRRVRLRPGCCVPGRFRGRTGRRGSSGRSWGRGRWWSRWGPGARPWRCPTAVW